MKIRVPRAFLSFVIVALLAVVPTIIEVPCPVCEGTGALTGTKGLEVKGIEYELVDYYDFPWGCGEQYWLETTYRVNISVVNEEVTLSGGYAVIKFYNPGGEQIEESESPIFTILIYIEIPAKTAENVERILAYEGFALNGQELNVSYWEPHRLSAEMGEGIMCPVCAGKGKLAFTERLKMIIQ